MFGILDIDLGFCLEKNLVSIEKIITEECSYIAWALLCKLSRRGGKICEM